jgi:hypothetical protein
MAYMTLPFNLNSLGSGISTCKKADYFAKALGINLMVKRNERVMNPTGSDVNMFVFENGEVAIDSLTTYTKQFIAQFFPTLDLRDISSYNNDDGYLWVTLVVYDKDTQVIEIVNVPL